jgi:hypothetical protein
MYWLGTAKIANFLNSLLPAVLGASKARDSFLRNRISTFITTFHFIKNTYRRFFAAFVVIYVHPDV